MSTFLQTPNQPISEYVYNIVSISQDWSEITPGGSGVIIGERLLLTAMHVIEHDAYHYDGLKIDGSKENKIDGSFSMIAFNHPNEGDNSIAWSINKIWSKSGYDLCISLLNPFCEKSKSFMHKGFPKIKLLPPKIGDKLYCFGYPNIIHENDIASGEIVEKFFLNEFTISCNVTDIIITSNGVVRIVTDGHSENHMSGAPVFNDQGEICGIIRGEMFDFMNVNSISSILAIEIECELVKGIYKKLTVYDLAKRGQLFISDLHLVTERINEEGKRIGFIISDY